MCKGFKQISNDFFESDYWRQSRTYNDCEAVLDIISQVRFEASEHTARIGGREVTWSQAQWPASVRFLAARWHWTEWRVRSFLSGLRRKGIIETADDQGVNMITLKKFLIFKSEEAHTPYHTLNKLEISELVEKLTQQLTQQDTVSHSTHTKHNNGNKNKDSSLRSESTLFDMEEEFPFKDFWELYDKKVGKSDCQKVYAKISLKDRKAIFEYLPKYIQAQPVKQFRKNPLTFLHQRAWEDEIIIRNRNETTSASTGCRAAGSPTNEQLVNDTYDLINEARARENVDDSF